MNPEDLREALKQNGSLSRVEDILLKFTVELLTDAANYIDETVVPQTHAEAHAKANCIAAVKEFARTIVRENSR